MDYDLGIDEFNFQHGTECLDTSYHHCHQRSPVETKRFTEAAMCRPWRIYTQMVPVQHKPPSPTRTELTAVRTLDTNCTAGIQ
ncbi:uncharacterized protein B0H18DRAFT_969153 [Fomitopsis serialis]|uniref:uncharacterized protein n=1 Tax=Fomitopsis serialis TaxID=139415 RepID=UPI0020085FF7|nr:uncharacterized protein B0H18DRAFT_969153 [Neoantrodia serialis]KAH9937107.1 hypothetical protein B0H18DRAFT_969153 [Neoantrodia serialis]